VVPGGATQSLSVEAPAVYDGLPDGAVCDIEETDAGDAASTTMTPAADATGTTARITVAVDTVAEITVDNAFDAGKSPDDEELTPTGGDGTLVLLVGGAALLLIVAGGILLIARRRES
jgi:LPXTG-motif cell wall-anchored protein